VDCLAPRVVCLTFVVLLASTLDAAFTLYHLQAGIPEANPVMVLALTGGDRLFVSLKMAMTGLGTWLLAVHQHFPLAYRGLHGLALTYSVVLLYHLLLIYHVE
jgi:hypothetical protein